MCVNGCDKPAYRRGICTSCYWQHRQASMPPCTVEDCDRPQNAKGLCITHGQRVNRYGRLTTLTKDERRSDFICYRAAHTRVRTDRGRADQHPCIDCGRQAQEWSYDHSGRDEQVDVVRGYLLVYSGDPDAYQPRCRRCHRKWDAA